jgi:RNA recognition motif-containing protein
MDYKLFVGNIPFDCKLNEFREAFKKCKGYVTADLINNSSSRCFGFIVLRNKECLEELLNKNNVFLKDRKLRLTRYNNKTKETNNYLKLDNIPNTSTSEDIKNEFENYSEIGKCFIDMDRLTGVYKTTGIIEILEEDIFYKMLNLDSILVKDIPINISKYENKSIKKEAYEHYQNC